jgi:hypothetical protein
MFKFNLFLVFVRNVKITDPSYNVYFYVRVATICFLLPTA